MFYDIKYKDETFKISDKTLLRAIYDGVIVYPLRPHRFIPYIFRNDRLRWSSGAIDRLISDLYELAFELSIDHTEIVRITGI